MGAFFVLHQKSVLFKIKIKNRLLLSFEPVTNISVMLKKETVKQFGVVLLAVMVGLAVHDKFVAPRLKK